MKPPRSVSASRLNFGRTYILGSTLISASLVGVILLTLLIMSLPGLYAAGGSLLGTVWQPNDSQYGILPMLYGSVIVMVIAMSLALPVALLSAMGLYQIRNPALKKALRAILEILAGIPSIVYGLIAVAGLSLWVQDAFDLQTGRIILTAGLILSVMILPTILSLTDDAFSNIRQAYPENGRALGLYPYEVMRHIILPQAKPDIIAAALLALGRALGETMAVMLVIGSIDRLPSPLWNVLSSGQTITSKLGREVGESAFGSVHFSVLVLTSLILVCITLTLTVIAQKLFKTQSEYGGLHHI